MRWALAVADCLFDDYTRSKFLDPGYIGTDSIIRRKPPLITVPIDGIAQEVGLRRSHPKARHTEVSPARWTNRGPAAILTRKHQSGALGAPVMCDVEGRLAC